ncbi:mitochondrial translation initiation factor 2 [Truncatella angustata]|uniref:Translation initiation factor IF-2, mitochondrial n=1 Tax=Truncatella angustata TaxID=152316 RepID=A0A9P8RJH7_9PEZI|nr:mitochondrial translation initiation factor 2 [Truncatella angustata]KAH6638563.1 mitochondrial translation initiation factor 2 [Truncatella angustata]
MDYDEYLERRKKKIERKAKREAERTEPQSIALPELISISNLATALKVDKSVFLGQLAELGFEGISLDSIMAGETAALVAQEYGFEPTVDSGEQQDLKARPPPEDPSTLPPRPPVVTIMGHVDHGKTTLLDYLRKSSVAAGEHGGITQHIGAFSVSMSTGKQITFLDTPGHAAFLTMRQRGAHVTDIVVLVVAADDSVKPQTLEALKHARQSKVPIIVAINKIDKDGAHVDRVNADLASNGVEIEDYGGDVQVVCVSGKTGQGMEDLEENILTLAEILDMRAEVDGQAEGWILESSLKPIGKVATILVKRGTLRPGDFIAAGTTYAKIRHLRNEAGQEIKEAPPGTPVEILGWRDLPAAGDEVIQGTDERRVRQAAEYREHLREREQDAAAHEKIAEQRRQLSEQRRAEKANQEGKYKRPDGSWGTQEQEPSDTDENGAKLINFLVKGDVHGSVEAVCAAIQEIGSNEVRPRVLMSSPGAITESDVEHAATSGSAIVNFNLPISGQIKRQAETAGVKILDHSVIYHLTDDVRDYLGSFLGVDITFKVLAEAEVLQVFPINIKGRQYKNIAGCRIRNGTVERNQLLRVLRGGEMLFEGKLESFKHGKKDIDEARKGGECGIGFELFQDLEQGDQIQAIEEVQTKRTL